MEFTLNELEQAINYWRAAKPSTGEEQALSPEVNALANVYASMIFNRVKSMPIDALQPICQQLVSDWRTSTQPAL